ncbi:pyrin [Carlito syrichta]|uniref:Pyrin n=2 Tax=Carlito syrichta TaxID=1868482 RepID=A0A1U7UAM3_CARSF|nr:pyrin [Carlito syrichta]
MAKTPSDHLLFTLEELVPYDFEKFKFKLQNTTVEKEHSRIPRGQLQVARPVKVANMLITHYGEEYAVRLTLQVLRAINQRLLAEELHKATAQEYPTQESDTDSSAVSCSSGENKLKSMKIADCPERNGLQPGGDGTSLLPNQPEAGIGPQKKPQGRRRDQKASKGLDEQGKPQTQSPVPLSRRTLCPGKSWGDSQASTSLCRNASSAGRLQGLSSGALGRRESKKFEVCLPSGKKRPKSLELTVSVGEGEPPNPETLLTQEEIRTANLGIAAILETVATLDVGTNAALEKGSRNPEHPMVLEREPLRNLLSNALLAGEKESTAPQEENRIEAPETPEILGGIADSVSQESSNPQVPAPSGRPPTVSPLCQAQEGDSVGGACELDSCSCPVASGDPQPSGNHLGSCNQCQALPSRKSSGSLRPQSLPQCKRHMKQAQLLFCEDHREPICLICSLSQEHRGHWVRPIEEAALEYKEQIQKQLEHLKELRKSGEEQISQGEKTTANFLKQTEYQKQRVRSQLEQLCQFLEQQEQLFVAWLEELNQTIGQVRETYTTRVSRDIALLNMLIGELEAKRCQSEWELLQDIRDILCRAKMVPAPEQWVTPPQMKEKIHLFCQKSELVEKSMKSFSDKLSTEMKTFSVLELTGVQAYAVNVLLDEETAHPNLIFSDNLKSVRLGNKCDQLPDGPERFDSCIFTLGSSSFLSGRHYWEVEVGDKTGWVLGVCKASLSRKGSITLSPENGYWVVMMMKRNEYQATTFPPTRLQIREPPKRVGIFLDFTARGISFYNVTARSHIYTFSRFSSSGPLQPIFSPGVHDGGKNMGPLTICPVGRQEPH